MELQIEKLIEAINNLKDSHGETHQAMTESSGVHNIGKIVAKKITPMPESWWKLYKAYPEYIPKPSYKDGSAVYKTVTATGANAVAAGKNITNTSLTTSEQYLIDLLREVDKDGSLLKETIATLLQKS